MIFSAEILLIEDNAADEKLLRMIFRDCAWVRQLRVVHDGESALDYLHRQGKYAEATRPDFIILDWNIPRRDGREVLAEIKRDPSLQTIPLVVFTSSEAQEDIEQSRALGADFYLNKKTGLDDFVTVVGQMETIWRALARVPDGSRQNAIP